MTAIDLVGCDTQAFFGDPAQHVGGEHALVATRQHPGRDVRTRPERESSPYQYHEIICTRSRTSGAGEAPQDCAIRTRSLRSSIASITCLGQHICQGADGTEREAKGTPLTVYTAVGGDIAES
jgi:hypothetical protein